MRTLRILFAKELNATLTSPIGYTVAAVFLLVLGYTFSLTLFVTKVANLQYIFHQMYVLSILLVPVLTMRTFAEERRSETLELLLTAPVRELSVVLAKYAATLTLVLGIFALTLIYAVILGRYGEPDWGPIYAGYLALALHASLLVAVGLLMSSITESQVVAAALSIGAFLMLWFADSVSYLLPPPFDSFAINLSLIGHFKPMVSGSVFLSDIGYFVTASMLAPFPHHLGACAAMSDQQGSNDLPAEDTSFLHNLLEPLQSLDWINLGWFAGVVFALAVLFAAGLKVPARLAFASRIASATLVAAAAVAVTILANVALFRHDAHLDLTHEKAFTPSAEAREVVRRLSEPIEVVYFYQKQNQAARALGAMLRQLERLNGNFRVQLIDADQNPALASSQGVRTYNSAVLRAWRTPRRSNHHRRSRDRAWCVAAAAHTRGRDLLRVGSRRIRYRQLRIPHAFRGCSQS